MLPEHQSYPVIDGMVHDLTKAAAFVQIWDRLWVCNFFLLVFDVMLLFSWCKILITQNSFLVLSYFFTPLFYVDSCRKNTDIKMNENSLEWDQWQWNTTDAEIKVLPAENRELSKPWVGQNIALHASPTARDSPPPPTPPCNFYHPCSIIIQLLFLFPRTACFLHSLWLMQVLIWVWKIE